MLCIIDILMEKFRDSALQDGSKEKRKNARKLMNMAMHVCRVAKIKSVYQLGSASHLERIESLYIREEGVAANTIANHLRALGNFVSFLAYNDFLGIKFDQHMKEVFIYKREQFLKPINKRIRIETAKRLANDQGISHFISLWYIPISPYRHVL